LENPSNKTLVKNINWNFIKVMSVTVLGFVNTIFFARLLPPKEFGLLSIVLVFIGLANIFSTMGVGPAIIQKKVITQEHTRAGFTISLSMAVIVCIIMWSISPIVSNYFHQERLEALLRLVAVQFIFFAISTVSVSLLMRELNYKKIFLIDFSSYLIGSSIISIILAYNGLGVWSIVIGNLCTALISSFLYYIVVKPPLRPIYKKDIFWDLINFGGGVSLNTFLNYIANNIDYLIIGRYLNANSVGLYNRAFQLMRLPLGTISGALSNVLFSSYSRIQEEKQKLTELYFSSISSVNTLTFPLFIGMCISAKYIIYGLYGAEWEGAVKAFQYLCIAGVFKVIFNLAGPIVKATGHVYVEVRKQFIYCLVLIFGCLFGVKYGITGVACVVILASMYLYFAMAKVVLKILNSRWKQFFYAHIPGIVIGSIVYVINNLAVLTLERYISGMYVAKLIIVLFILGITYLLSLVILPKALVGEVPKKVVSKMFRKSYVSSKQILNQKYRSN